ncbi:MAG: hypothetical protein AABZ30_01655 [Myxococcota bacterium]
MVEATLVEEGRRVVSALRTSGVPLDFAVWFANPSSEEMTFAIGSRAIDQMGPTASYQKVVEAIGNFKDDLRHFRLDQIKLTSVESQMGRALFRSFGNKDGDAMVGMYVSPEVVLQQVYAYATA